MQHKLVKAHALFKKLTKLLLVALFCGVGSCGLFDDGYYLRDTTQKVLGGGVINDSTAMLFITNYEYWGNDGHFGSGGGGEERNREYYLALVDIRFEKIYWKKPVKSNFGTGFTLIDSVMFFVEARTSAHTGKISTLVIDKQFDQLKKIELKFKNIELNSEAWDYYSSGNTIRPWHSGLILARGMGQYALIDTTVGTYKLWNPTEEFAWVNECADVKWSSVGGLCLKQIPDTTGFVLLKNAVDTLAVRYNISKGSAFNGSYIASEGVYMLNNQGQVSKDFLDVVHAKGIFFDSKGNFIVDYNKKF